MTRLILATFSALALWCPLALSQTPITPVPPAEADDETIILSPFTVNADDDRGYQATTTLAGSRIRSNIRDLGASIVVATKEFIEDLSATDSQSLLTYLGNTEVGGTFGNFSDTQFDGNRRLGTNSQRRDPQNSQRIRGLVSAALTRDYFQTIVPFDAYNTGRVTVNRGPNSVLFGLGTPGGVIDNSTNRAMMNADFKEMEIGFGQRGSNRQTIDVNQTLIEDGLAVRLSALHDELNYQQEPAFRRDARFYAALDLTLSKNKNSSWLGRTSLRAAFEKGDIDSNPPDVLPPTDAYSNWWIGYRDPLALLRVPGVTIAQLKGELGALSQQDVRDAVAAGLAQVPPGMTLDQFAADRATFIPLTTVERFTREGLNNVRNSTPYFLSPALNRNSGSAPVGYADPALAGISGIQGRWFPVGKPAENIHWTFNLDRRLPGFNSFTMQDRNIFDYRNRLFQGTMSRVDTDFEIQQVFLEQPLFGGKAGIEIAYDNQSVQRYSRLPFGSDVAKEIYIDVTRHQPNGDTNRDGVGDGFLNENLGRPVVRLQDFGPDERWDDQETIRATLYGTLDTRSFTGGRLGKILGSHTFTGLFEDRRNDSRFENHRPIFIAEQGDSPGASFISNGANNAGTRVVYQQVYVGPSMLGTTLDQFRVTDQLDFELPKAGDKHRIIYFDNRNNVKRGVQNEWTVIEPLINADLGRRDLDSTAFSMQSRWLDEHLITLAAWRKDEQKVYRRLQEDVTFPNANNPSLVPLRTAEGNFNESLLFLEDTPASVDDDSTFTWSVVGVFPEKHLFELPWGMDLSAHYYEAESFQPAGISNNILNQPLDSPRGETTEYGFTVELLNRRLSARFNWYETTNANARTNIGGALGSIVGRIPVWLERTIGAEDSGIPITQTDAAVVGASTYDQFYAKIIGILPAEVQSVYDFRVVEAINPSGGVFHQVESNRVDGLSSTFDFVAEGLEVDLVGRLTDNWNVSLNVAQQKTVRSNTAPIAGPLTFQIEENLIAQGFNVAREAPFASENGTFLERYRALTSFTVRSELAKDDTVSAEQREWRVNLISRYDFTRGPLKGFSVGGALRWQSDIAAGYPIVLDEFGNQIPDIGNPFRGPEEWNGDMFLRYRRSFSDGKLDWSIQLNARNLYRGDGEDIPVSINPDGAVAVIRIPPERQFILSNTFRF